MFCCGILDDFHGCPGVVVLAETAPVRFPGGSICGVLPDWASLLSRETDSQVLIEKRSSASLKLRRCWDDDRFRRQVEEREDSGNLRKQFWGGVVPVPFRPVL